MILHQDCYIPTMHFDYAIMNHAAGSSRDDEGVAITQEIKSPNLNFSKQR